MAKQEETQTMEEYLLSQLDTPVVLKDDQDMPTFGCIGECKHFEE